MNIKKWTNEREFLKTNINYKVFFIFSDSIMFQYFVKIVPTTYVKLNGDVSTLYYRAV